MTAPESPRPYEIEVFATKEAAADALAEALAGALRAAITERGRGSIALSGGESPRPAYTALAGKPGIDWTRVHVFFVDERAVPPASERSNFRLARETLLAPGKIPEAQVHRMVGEVDLAGGVADYGALLAQLSEREGSIDVGAFGVGDDGHTASLFPNRPDVDEEEAWTLGVPARPDAKTEPRITMTARAIRAVRARFVLATGAGKKAALDRVFAPAGSLHETPARVLLLPGTTFLVDEAARG